MNKSEEIIKELQMFEAAIETFAHSKEAKESIRLTFIKSVLSITSRVKCPECGGTNEFCPVREQCEKPDTCHEPMIDELGAKIPHCEYICDCQSPSCKDGWIYPDVEKLIKGIKTVRALIDESNGVMGLHLNGDLAPWSELEQGGRFEEWLFEFNEAEQAIKGE